MKILFMKLAFIGTGYVGLVTGTLLATLGHDVTCIDVDADKIDMLKKGKSPIYEKDLEAHIASASEEGKLHFAWGVKEGVTSDDFDAVFITVGTPPLADGSADLGTLHKVITQVASLTKKKTLIVIKSTVPPGTSLDVQEDLKGNGYEHKIANNPEFLREGNAVEDFLNPHRIVVGVADDRSREIMRQIYAPKTEQGTIYVETDLTTSEMIKYASNTFLANKIAFINEMADLCEEMGADVKDLSYAVGLDTRIGGQFLKAGPGFGGSCFPKDILALQHLAKERQVDSLILDAVIKANSNRPDKMIGKIEDICGGIARKKFAILGLTYKAGTDDLRSSPSLEIIEKLRDKGADIVAFDPMGMKNASKCLSAEELAETMEQACEEAAAIILVTEWEQFKNADFKQVARIVKSKTIIDLRNFLDRKKVMDAGFAYHAVGLSAQNS